MPIKSQPSPIIDATATGHSAAEASEATPESPVQSPAEAARERAVQYMAERRYVDARKALEEAESLEAEPLKARAQRMITSIRSRIPKRDTEAPAPTTEATAEALSPVDKSLSTVGLYSKIAAGVGLLPGGLLNFAAILAVQVTMIWKIANTFGHTDGKERIRGSILSLIGSVLPTGVGHGAGLAIAAIPAMIAGTVVYFVVTPVLAYAMTQAVGKAYIMHFESGGTLLSFDPKAFTSHFLHEFRTAGGIIKTDAAEPAKAGPDPLIVVAS